MTDFQRLAAALGLQVLLFAVCLGVTAPGFARAADFDGSHKLLCAPTDAIQCEGAGECERAEVEDLNIPKFLTIEQMEKLTTKRLLAYKTSLYRVPEGPSHEETMYGGTDFAMHKQRPEWKQAVAEAKAFASEAFPRLGVTGIQLHGGVGFTEEYDIQLYLKRSKWVRPMFGDEDFHYDRIAALGEL